MKATPIDKLQTAIDKALAEYAESAQKDVEQLSRTFAKKGAQAVKQAAAGAYGSGKYSKGWTSTFETGRLSAQGVIYNKTPGLPHLLEHGHRIKSHGKFVAKSTRASHFVDDASKTVYANYERKLETVVAQVGV